MDPLQTRIDAINDRLEALASRNTFSDDDRREVAKLQSDRARLMRDQQAGKGRQTTAATAPGTVARTDAEGRPTAFYEESNETVNLRFGDERGARRALAYRQQRAENMRALRSANYVPWGEFKSFADMVRFGFETNGGHRFEERHKKHFAAVLGMSEGSGSDGGYTVMPEFNNTIIDRVYSNGLWGMTDNYTVTGNNLTFLANAETSRANGSRHGGVRGYYVNEGGTFTSSKPTLREISMKLIKIGALVYLTQELIDDGGAALQAYVAQKVAQELEFIMGDGLVNGVGAGQLYGMLNFPSLISITKESGQPAASLMTENIVKMGARFYGPNFGMATWLHNQDIQPELDTMTLSVGTGGIATYLPGGSLVGAPNGTLRGRPLMPTEFNATLGTAGDLLLADMKNILTINKGGVNQAVSTEVAFLTDQLALRFVIRVNSSPWESAPITPYKGASNTQSNFVTIETRS